MSERERLKMDSSLDRLVLAARISGVIKGFCERKGDVTVFSGACLSRRVDSMEVN